MSERVVHILFLGTGNPARSIMAEVILNHLGGGRCTASSAGSHPKGTVHPRALETLQSMGLPVDGLRSKSWQECARPDAPPLDMIVTVCDAAAGEVCPLWPGQPMTAHWGVEDLAAATQRVLPWREVLPYIALQVLGAFAGVAAAHLMFGEPLFFASLKVRTRGAQWWSEFVATFGLLMVIWGCVRQHITAVPYAVAAYITSAYWFTASTSFANPAVTLARAASNTFAGIRPDDVAAFILAQLLGAAAATLVLCWLLPLPLPTD